MASCLVCKGLQHAQDGVEMLQQDIVVAGPVEGVHNLNLRPRGGLHARATGTISSATL